MWPPSVMRNFTPAAARLGIDHTLRRRHCGGRPAAHRRAVDVALRERAPSRSARWASTTVEPAVCDASGRNFRAGQQLVDAADQPPFVALAVQRVARAAGTGTPACSSGSTSSRLRESSVGCLRALLRRRAARPFPGRLASRAQQRAGAVAKLAEPAAFQPSASPLVARRRGAAPRRRTVEARLVLDLLESRIAAGRRRGGSGRRAGSSARCESSASSPTRPPRRAAAAGRTSRTRRSSRLSPMAGFHRLSRGKRRGDGRLVLELQVVRRRQRRVDGRVPAEVPAGMIALQLQQADFGLRADEADVELRLPHDGQRAGQGDDRRADPRPLDASQGVKHHPVERHEHDQVHRQAGDDEARRRGRARRPLRRSASRATCDTGRELAPRAQARRARSTTTLSLRGSRSRRPTGLNAAGSLLAGSRQRRSRALAFVPASRANHRSGVVK